MDETIEFWLGNRTSIALYGAFLRDAQAPGVIVEARSGRGSGNDGSDLLDVQGNIGIIRITGPLLSYSNEMTRYFGMVGYPDIREALVEAAQRDDIGQILLDIDSPGGSASGIQDVSDLIAKVRSDYKPVTAYSSGVMNSGGYWIGVSAEKVYASRMASVGGIGVVGTHFEVTRQLEAQGVKPTVFRSGEFKALGGPYEVLSDKAKAVIQGNFDTTYTEFVNHVATSRGVSPAIVKSKMAEGREFFGFEALAAGLIDGVMSFDDLAVKLGSAKTTGSRTTIATRLEADTMATKRKLLDEKTVAALAAGADVEAALNSAPEAPEVPAEPESPETTEVPEAAEAPAEAEVASPMSADLTSYLRTELSSAQEKVLTMTMENRDLTGKLAAVESTHPQMRQIVSDAINFMRVGLGGANSDLASLSDEALLQQHVTTKAEFQKTYPVGGKSSLPSTDPQVSSVVPMSQARRNAVKT